MRYIKLIVKLSLLFASSIAYEMGIGDSMPAGGVFIGGILFVVQIAFAFLVYENLKNILMIANDKSQTVNTWKYRLILIVSIILVGIGLIVNTEVIGIDASIRAVSLILVILIIDLTRKIGQKIDLT